MQRLLSQERAKVQRRADEERAQRLQSLRSRSGQQSLGGRRGQQSEVAAGIGPRSVAAENDSMQIAMAFARSSSVLTSERCAR